MQTRKVAGMDDASTGQLKRVIEVQHGVKSTFVKSVRVYRSAASKNNWDGVVHVFELNDHPKAKRAFAWSSPIFGSAASRFFSVLQTGQITTPIQAVKAASAAIRKWGTQGTNS